MIENPILNHQTTDKKANQKARGRAYYEANREKVIERSKQWAAANPERSQESKRRRRAENPEKIAANSKAWKESNPEKVLASAKVYREANPDKVLAAGRLWRAANPEKEKENGLKWRERNPEAASNGHVKRKYGLTFKQVIELFEAAGDSCECCGTPVARPGSKEGRKNIGHVDHCHATKKVRGILCFECNTGLGQLKDRPDLAVAYLEKTT